MMLDQQNVIALVITQQNISIIVVVVVIDFSKSISNFKSNILFIGK